VKADGNVLFWSCCSKPGDGRVVITFYVTASFLFFFYYNAEGDGNKAVVAFYFGLIATKKATTKLSLLSLLQQAFYLFFVTVRKVTATTLTMLPSLPSPSILVLL
jgi:hypothetical protein